MRVALNGSGRIAKNIIRIWSQSAQPDWQLSMIHMGSGDPESLPYGLTYDTIMGVDRTVSWHFDESTSALQGPHGAITIVTGRSIDRAMWKRADIDIVIDATGAYTQRVHAQEHITVGGARTVIITAPMDQPDSTVVLGYNTEHLFSGNLISIASCTTNATVPLLACISAYDIQEAHVSTIHAYTQSQSLLDGDVLAKDPRAHRAAPDNIIPHGTGAARAVVQVMPEMAGKVYARAYRVPVSTVSLVEIVARVSRPPETHQAFIQGIGAYTEKNQYVDRVTDPVVSSDLKGTYASVYIDESLSYAIPGSSTVVIAGWYDNEWAYAQRVCDAVALLATR